MLEESSSMGAPLEVDRATRAYLNIGGVCGEAALLDNASHDRSADWVASLL